MKQTDDQFTRDAFDAPRRGRPRKHDAKTPAQRMREYRLRLKEAQRSQQADAPISVTRYEK
ncbi:hypothetical protein [Noviherbaspirillum sp.]|uniref:hypothetical protein n=1 Tax=Noviherbaspirillum sp. TaxID=1926288 RepID=UPI002B4A3161|nr:hypothetical protein [Noviherbaspirillum sp.]HJV82448.1 hypothetical protein [Noviherbaspirillum sp.]